MKHLIGHVSPETAFLIDDYPYGFRLRCKIRYWLEYKPGFGYRFVSQTTNPKTSVEVWNKPKPGIYYPLAVMVQHEANAKGIKEVHCEVVTPGRVEELLESFIALHSEALQGEQEQRVIKTWHAVIERVNARRAQLNSKARDERGVFIGETE